MKSAIAMEFALVEVAFIDNTVRKSKFADALRPALFCGADEVAA